MRRQYKPVTFGDPPDPGTVESHRAAVEQRRREREEARQLSRYLNMVYPEPTPPGLLMRMRGFVRRLLRRG